MNKRVAIVVAVLVVVGGSAAAVSVFQLYGTDFHYEAHMANDSISSFLVSLENMADCNLTIGSTDDPLLTYSLDISLYEPGSHGSAFTVDLRGSSGKYRLLLNYCFSGERIRSVSLLLGSTVNYTIHVRSSTNLNSTIIFSNNTLLPDGSLGFMYDATGVLRIGIDEDVRVNRWFHASVKTNVTAVFIDLPEGVNGRIRFLSYMNYGIADRNGWYYRGEDTYTTETQNEPPMVNVEIDGYYAVAVLYD